MKQSHESQFQPGASILDQNTQFTLQQPDGSIEDMSSYQLTLELDCGIRASGGQITNAALLLNLKRLFGKIEHRIGTFTTCNANLKQAFKQTQYMHQKSGNYKIASYPSNLTGIGHLLTTSTTAQINTYLTQQFQQISQYQLDLYNANGIIKNNVQGTSGFQFLTNQEILADKLILHLNTTAVTDGNLSTTTRQYITFSLCDLFPNSIFREKSFFLPMQQTFDITLNSANDSCQVLAFVPGANENAINKFQITETGNATNLANTIPYLRLSSLRLTKKVPFFQAIPRTIQMKELFYVDHRTTKSQNYDISTISNKKILRFVLISIDGDNKNSLNTYNLFGEKLRVSYDSHQLIDYTSNRQIIQHMFDNPPVFNQEINIAEDQILTIPKDNNSLLNYANFSRNSVIKVDIDVKQNGLSNSILQIQTNKANNVGTLSIMLFYQTRIFYASGFLQEDSHKLLEDDKNKI